jgi:hypothetical protein
MEPVGAPTKGAEAVLFGLVTLNAGDVPVVESVNRLSYVF